MEETTPNHKPYGPAATVAVTLVIYIAAQLLAGVLISIIPFLRHWTSAQTTAWLQDNVWAMFAFVAIIESITLGLLYMFLRQRKLSFSSLGLDKAKTRYILYALSGFGVYFVLYIIGLLLVKIVAPGLNLDQKQEIGFSASASGRQLVPIFLSLVILPPVTEEIVARGFLFGGLRTKLPFVTAAVITSIMFAAAHLGETTGGLLWVGAIDTFILSLVLCYLREKTGSLWPSIGVHMIKNGLAFIVLFNIVQYIR
ncbi:MAG TPA: type II CAAX endopeptidase family protein [Candidatus Saccharimonadales bacterium]|nr:type II CAAX endopeptidase family protein [Candidatus Saccharimonadales bacterium]